MRRALLVVVLAIAGCGDAAPPPTTLGAFIPEDLILDASDLGTGWSMTNQELAGPALEAIPRCGPDDPDVATPVRYLFTEFEQPDIDVGLTQVITSFSSATDADGYVAAWSRLSESCEYLATLEDDIAVTVERWTPPDTEAIGFYQNVTGPDLLVHNWGAVRRFGTVVVAVLTFSGTSNDNSWVNLGLERTRDKAS